MSTCAELDGLLAERALAPLEPEDEARLSAHLTSCERCSASLAAYRDVLDLARLDPVEEEALAGAVAGAPAARQAPGERSRAGARPSPGAGGLAVLALGRWRARRRRQLAALVLGAGLGAAAALVLVVMSPRLGHVASPQPVTTAAVVAEWEPDVDGALEAATLAMADGADDDAALASWEAGGSLASDDSGAVTY